MRAAERPWGRPDPAVAQTRVAVRRALAELREPGGAGTEEPATDGAPIVLVALSGGADSLALAAALAFEAPRAGVRAGAVIVDHGLQAASAEIAERAAGRARALGLDPVLVRRVEVPGAADGSAVGAGEGGPEAAARRARYAAIEAVRAELGAGAVLTAHTRDDQAEQVILALARGSGTRAIAGIPPVRGAIRRPFLAVSRETTARACAAQGLEPWHDPHNDDPAYTRVRVRSTVLPLLERELGPGIPANLARAAELAREDAEALDLLAAEALEAAAERTGSGILVAVPVLAGLPSALRTRVIRGAARACADAQLERVHTAAIAALVTDWRGQGPIDAPGLRVARIGDQLEFAPRDGHGRRESA